jgi:putative ABC transport system permease protein
MIRHLLKLIWNRRRANLLLMVEVALSFLVLFAVSTLAAHALGNYRLPLGFSIDDVWSVTIRGEGDDEAAQAPPEVQETTRQLFAAVAQLPEVVAVAGTDAPPYQITHRGYITNDGVRFEVAEATDTLPAVLGLELTAGHWFSKADDGADHGPVVINERLAGILFGAQNPIGREVQPDWAPDGQTRTRRRVVGVIRDYRRDGETSSPQNYQFRRRSLDEPGRWPPNHLLIKLRPGTPAAFEEKLVERMQSVARSFRFEVDAVSELRRRALDDQRQTYWVVGLVAGFLMLMVALGLTGVLWQNVTQRTKEIGLRRAKGATRAAIQRQILAELLVMTSLALGVGALIVAHVPMFDLIASVTSAAYLQGLLISVLAIYLLTLLCGWYPARLAARVPPALALHHE